MTPSLLTTSPPAVPPPAEGARAPSSVGELARDFVSLTKPRLSSQVLFTTAGGAWLAHAPLSALGWVALLAGTAGTVGAANAFNCYLERDSDRFMRRTAGRPLPSRRMEPARAFAFAGVLAGLSLPSLAFGVNLLTGFLGLLALVSYVGAYTPLKSRTHWAMLVGAVPGALPPLMGWTAATGQIELPGLALFAILFFWQLPHFIAIALFRKEEYRAAGLTSLPLEHGDDTARRHAVGYLVALVGVSVLPVMLHVTGKIYLGAAVSLGALFLGVGVHGLVTRGDETWAWRLFRVSLVYLSGLFAALALSAIA